MWTSPWSPRSATGAADLASPFAQSSEREISGGAGWPIGLARALDLARGTLSESVTSTAPFRGALEVTSLKVPWARPRARASPDPANKPSNPTSPLFLLRSSSSCGTNNCKSGTCNKAQMLRRVKPHRHAHLPRLALPSPQDPQPPSPPAPPSAPTRLRTPAGPPRRSRRRARRHP